MVPCAYWIQTLQGGVYDYTSVKDSTHISPKVIAHSLARIQRFLSHSTSRWSVAEHSLLVANLGLQLCETEERKKLARPYLLLHDAHEAFLGDMPAPLKKFLKDKHNFDMKKLELECDRRIRTDLGLDLYPPSWINDLIHEVDVFALKIERDVFMMSKHEWVIDTVKIPVNLTIPVIKETSPSSISRFFRTEISNSLEDYHAVCSAQTGSSQNR